MQILRIQRPQEIKQIMRDIKVDPYGIQIMLPKAVFYLIKLNSISNITANILKQEMLSLGGDVALARGALTGKTKKTDCLLIGNLSQYNKLNLKLAKQPFGLKELSANLNLTLKNYQKESFTLDLGRSKLNLDARKTCIMGIMNLTPDSFSSDGLYKELPLTKKRISGRVALEYIVDYAQDLVVDGANIIDLGGESSRPGAKPVSVKEELARTIPVIKALAKKIKVPISIDTYKPEIAQAALDNGAIIVNDITGLENKKLAKLIAKHKAAVVIMHMRGVPRTMQKNPKYASLIEDILGFLNAAAIRAQEAGISKDKIIIDPGIGFGKTLEHNLEIIKRLGELKVLGFPILIGTSRKLFIGKILNAEPQDRIFGSISSCILAAINGAKILRVHDVKETKQALKILNSIGN